MPWWGWALLLVVVVVVWVALWWARNNPRGYMDRTKGRVALWATWLDDVETILESDPIRMGALTRVEGKFDALADAQRKERVPDAALEQMNARAARLFEIERNVIKDLRTTGGANLGIMRQERWDLMSQLGLAEAMRARYADDEEDDDD